jgi:hypothetical protein
MGRVSAEGGAELLRALATHGSVTLLDLRWNALGVAGAEALAAALRTNTALTTVRVCGNRMGDAGLTALVSALVHNTTVQELIAGHNGVGDAGGEALFRMLERNVTLRVVDVRKHSMSYRAGHALARMLRLNRSLVRLDARDRQYSWGDATSAVDAAAAVAAAARPGFSFVYVWCDRVIVLICCWRIFYHNATSRAFISSWPCPWFSWQACAHFKYQSNQNEKICASDEWCLLDAWTSLLNLRYRCCGFFTPKSWYEICGCSKERKKERKKKKEWYLRRVWAVVHSSVAPPVVETNTKEENRTITIQHPYMPNSKRKEEPE